MEDAARLLGFARASSYQYYESPTGFDRERLPAHIMDKLRATFVGLGLPPITAAEVDALNDGSAVSAEQKNPPIVGGDVTLVGAHADAVLLLLKQTYGVDFTRLPVYSCASETDARLAVARRKPKQSTLLSATNAAALGDPASLAVVIVDSDNMQPTIRSNAFVIMDTRPDHIAGEGVYAVVLGGRIAFRRCQHDAATGLIRLSNDNPCYPAVDIVDPLKLDVVGRAVWVAQRL